MAGKTRGATRYIGALARPIQIKPPNLGALVDPEQVWAEYQKRIVQAQLEKLPKLYAHYGLDYFNPADKARLVVSLALAHVPGFQVASYPGRPRRTITDVEVCFHVRHWLAQHPGRPVTEAARRLTKKALHSQI
jgi:hypothetical protein